MYLPEGSEWGRLTDKAAVKPRGIRTVLLCGHGRLEAVGQRTRLRSIVAQQAVYCQCSELCGLYIGRFLISNAEIRAMQCAGKAGKREVYDRHAV